MPQRLLTILAVVPLGLVSGCAAMIEYGTYLGDPAGRVAEAPEGAVQLMEGARREFQYVFFLGDDSAAGILTPVTSHNLLSTGPIIPVIPVPGGRERIGPGPFVLGLNLLPGPRSFLIVDPEQLLVRFDGVPEPVRPSRWRTVRSACFVSQEPPEVRAYGEGCLVVYEFDGMTTASVEQFTVSLPVIDADEVVYAMTDVDFEHGTIKVYR